MKKEKPLSEKGVYAHKGKVGFQANVYYEEDVKESINNFINKLKEMSFTFIPSELLDDWDDNLEEIYKEEFGDLK